MSKVARPDSSAPCASTHNGKRHAEHPQAACCLSACVAPQSPCTGGPWWRPSCERSCSAPDCATRRLRRNDRQECAATAPATPPGSQRCGAQRAHGRRCSQPVFHIVGQCGTVALGADGDSRGIGVGWRVIVDQKTAAVAAIHDQGVRRKTQRPQCLHLVFSRWHLGAAPS